MSACSRISHALFRWTCSSLASHPIRTFASLFAIVSGAPLCLGQAIALGGVLAAEAAIRTIVKLTRKDNRLVCSDGIYFGTSVRDKPHGKGKMFYTKGGCYEGNFDNGFRSGHGAYTYDSGEYYVGPWKNDLPHGKNGTRTTRNGFSFKGAWESGKYQSSLKNRKDRFLQQLIIGKSFEDSPIDYPTGFMSDFLRQNGWAKEAQILKRALNFNKSTPDNRILTAIYRTLKVTGNCLVLCDVEGHAIAINLARYHDDKNFVYCEIFNSGDGLDNHVFREKDQKHQTMLSIRVPTANLTADILTKLLSPTDSEQTIYRDILGIPGAEKVVPESPIWQKEQKADNCSIEWIFAYLKNKMSPAEYNKMRMKLFETCLEHACNDRIRKELQRKLKKRQERAEPSYAYKVLLDRIEV